MPDPENPAHLATVRPGHKRVDRRDVGLAVAIERRRTDRRRLSARPVPPGIVASLVGQAARHRTRLHPVAEEQARDRLVAALAEAARRQQYTPGYPAELAIWTRRCTAAHDGIPRASVPDAGADQDSPGLRRFPRGRLFAHPRRLEPDAEAATFMVVTTAGDGVVDQLRAGEATSAVLLAATRIGLACTPLSQAVEVGYTRRQLAEQILHVSGHPQLIIRIGWAQEGAAELPATPRRPLAFVLMPG
nr:nitroreductase family protein [Pseudonocardia acidicola]